ncbi:sensor histidine kinase [Fictibacillus iocasae]|uniref:histidine kinase n=1 Tax=Fictibacillus iocasae TaxID=2715437 RepID=A0ABW2NVA8_9BACL
MFRRLAVSFGTAASIILVIASLVIMYEVHHHLMMFQEDVKSFGDTGALLHHFEQALLSSIIWTAAGSLVLVALISYFVAKKLSLPLVQMRRAAEKMAGGELAVRVETIGNDELNDLGQSLNELASQLQQQEEARKTLTADVAHELRTPLSTVKSHLEAIEDGVFELSVKRVSGLKEEIDRLIDIVEDLEQLTRMESPEFELNKEKVDIGYLLEKSAQSLHASFIRKNIEFSLESNVTQDVLADAKRVSQIIVNLLNNALKYTPPGGSVTAKAFDEVGSVVLMIKDSGIGIAQEDQEKIFDRFYRTEKSRNRKYGGSGIGLTIVKKLVDAHSGDIWIESEPGLGTTFYVRFYH